MIAQPYTAAPNTACYSVGATGRGLVPRSFLTFGAAMTPSEIHRSGYPVLARVAFRASGAAGGCCCTAPVARSCFSVSP